MLSIIWITSSITVINTGVGAIYVATVISTIVLMIAACNGLTEYEE